MSDPDYDQVDFLIDNDPIELGRLYRELTVKHQLLQETYERVRVRSREVLGQVEAQRDTIRKLRAQVTAMGWEADGEGMGG